MTQYLHGLHLASVLDPYQNDRALDGDHPGLRVFTEAIGTNIAQPMRDYRPWSVPGHTVIARLNHGYAPAGTYPERARHPQFASACVAAIRASFGCHIWIVGNEPNKASERPPGEDIRPEDVARLAAAVRESAHTEPGHSEDVILLPGPAPWNTETGDWLTYLEAMIVGAQDRDAFDGVALHAYTHGADPALITSDRTMDPPYEDRYYEWRALYQQILRIPDDVILYVTEANPGADPNNKPWPEHDTGWIGEMYVDADEANVYGPRSHTIRGVALYRYPAVDDWAMIDKSGTIEAYRHVADIGYTVDIEEEPEMTEIRDGFEGGFYLYNGVNELECPNGWAPVWSHDPEDGVLDQPEYKPAGTAQIRNGEGAAAIHSRYTTLDGALYRTFEAKAVGAVSASVWMLKTEDGMGHGMRIGIDPAGGNDHTSSAIVWSDWYSQNSDDYEQDAWRERSVEAIAQSNLVTVFLRSKADFAANSTNAHFDDVLFSAEPPEPPTPPAEGDVALEVRVNGEVVWARTYGARMVEVG